MQVAAHVAELEQAGRLSPELPFAQLGRDERDPEGSGRRLPRPELQAAVRGRTRTPASPSRAGARCRTGPARRRPARRARPRPSHRAPAAAPRSTTATICGSASNRSSTGSAASAGTTTASRSDASRQRRGSPAASPPSSSAIDCTSGRLRWSWSGSDGRGARLALERGLQLALGLRPDPGHLSQPALARRLAQLLEVADSEHAPDLEHPLDRDAEEAAEPGQLRRDLPLELPQLGDLAGLDELLQPPFDAGADAAELARPALAHELGDRCGGRADQVGGAAVGTRGVRPGICELEQRRERRRADARSRRCPAVSPALLDSLSGMPTVVVPFRGETRQTPPCSRARGRPGDVGERDARGRPRRLQGGRGRRGRRLRRRRSGRCGRDRVETRRARARSSWSTPICRPRSRATCSRCSARSPRTASRWSPRATEPPMPSHSPRRTCSHRSTAPRAPSASWPGPTRLDVPAARRRDPEPRRRRGHAGRPRRARGTPRPAHSRRPRRAAHRPHAVKVVVLAGGLGGSRFARALAETIDPRRADHRRQRRRRRRDLRAPRLARSRHDPLHAHRPARRGARLGARGRDVEGARRRGRAGRRDLVPARRPRSRAAPGSHREAAPRGAALERHRASSPSRSGSSPRFFLPPTTGCAPGSRLPRASSPSRSGSSQRQHRDEVDARALRGRTLDRRRECVESLEDADLIAIAPSNPFVSIWPILAVAGIREALEERRVPAVAVSPLIGGKAVRGPADRMLARLAGGTGPRQVADCYKGLIDALVDRRGGRRRGRRHSDDRDAHADGRPRRAGGDWPTRCSRPQAALR